eukprot:SAG31_NODE_1953_length_6829_cov_6.548886_8_plen_229_part_00
MHVAQYQELSSPMVQRLIQIKQDHTDEEAAADTLVAADKIAVIDDKQLSDGSESISDAISAALSPLATQANRIKQQTEAAAAAIAAREAEEEQRLRTEIEEEVRQEIEWRFKHALEWRSERKMASAISIQAHWRGYDWRRKRASHVAAVRVQMAYRSRLARRRKDPLIKDDRAEEAGQISAEWSKGLLASLGPSGHRPNRKRRHRTPAREYAAHGTSHTLSPFICEVQ